ncbi:RluA family pseudouridine synthase [Alkalicoccobacillus murimartini]|uniref:Pseudouridine synthase n=1 Tax=Alkalicoccobacillus murimartini TaxID=171685 RepID=A0ABT9YJ41_9BACI|nr:RluA family pseudouridine synthase [Alkalicoccobacillus murimartini]MDQ0207880.1 23S rRNA pseudouridine1911/1915/1917 synthase [Alkalicoccobacillus murimartini]
MNNQPIFVWTVGESSAHSSLRAFLRVQKQVSKKMLTSIKFHGGSIKVNGVEKTVRTILEEGDVVVVHLPPESPSVGLIPEKRSFEILFEDEHLLVINKEAGMATIPSREHPRGTLANAVLAYYQANQIQATFHPVNRLDRGTSGLLIVAKHRYAHDQMGKQQKAGKLNRRYEALVQGMVEPSEGTITAPIGRNPNSIIERMVAEDGKAAVTHYKTITTGTEITHVSIALETGRTHQIRVHFSSIGHPLAGDTLYGGEMLGLSHQALHSCKLFFSHPFTGEEMVFEAKAPDDFLQLLAHIQQG